MSDSDKSHFLQFSCARPLGSRYLPSPLENFDFLPPVVRRAVVLAVDPCFRNQIDPSIPAEVTAVLALRDLARRNEAELGAVVSGCPPGLGLAGT